MSHWICRAWTEDVLNGWTGEIAPFDTKEEAEAYGKAFIRNIRRDDLAREYEVYEVFD